MNGRPRSAGWSRHTAITLALMVLTIALLVVEDFAIRGDFRTDAELARVAQQGDELTAWLRRSGRERTSPDTLLMQWRAFEARARPLSRRLDAIEADRALAQADRTIAWLAAALRRARAGAPTRSRLAAQAEAAVQATTAALRAGRVERRTKLVHQHRGFTAALVVFVGLQALWLTVPRSRRDAAAETEARDARQRLAFLAHHDELTGLANRRGLEGRLERLTAGGGRFGLILCDLDGFKPINDVFGHDAGDALLRTVAARLQRGLRPEDLAARLGGDEFVVVIAAIADTTRLATIAERMRHRLAEPVVHNGHHLRCAASLGTALFPDDGANPRALLSAADAAMYEAKQAGGMGVRAYTRRLRERDEMRHEIVRELETALADGGLSLVFQPQVDLATGHHVGFEALTRWPSRTRGDVPPSVFIPIAETAGLVPPLTTWLVGEVERLAAAWRTRGLEPACISVNVSGGVLVRDDVVAILAAAVASAPLAGGRIGIEITEDAMFGRNADAVLERLRLLHGRGMPIALDDFGTGYASLSHLARMPFDRLKIAGGFVRQLGVEPNAAAVMRTIVELAQQLGGRAVATCVETNAQLDLLRAHGCDEGQGFRFAPPLGAVETEAYLARKQRAVPAEPHLHAT